MEKTVGMRIRECRVKMGMTQEELAIRMCTKKSTISAYELDKIDVNSGDQSLEPQGYREEPEENYQTDKSYDDPHNKHCIHFFYILKLYYFTLSTEAFP